MFAIYHDIQYIKVYIYIYMCSILYACTCTHCTHLYNMMYIITWSSPHVFQPCTHTFTLVPPCQDHGIWCFDRCQGDDRGQVPRRDRRRTEGDLAAAERRKLTDDSRAKKDDPMSTR